MTNRSTLLVGSLPFEDEEQCMRRALETLGPQLFSLPDGEIGEKSAQFPRGNRIAWVMSAIEMLTADRDNWRVVREPVRGTDGMPIDYDHLQQLKPRRSPGELPQHVRLGYDRFFERSYPLFTELRRAYDQPHLKFQLGIPTGLAMGFAFASKLDWLRYTGAFNTVLAREVNHALAQAGDDLIVQLELPPEVYAAYLLPRPLHRLALRSVLDLVGKITPGAQIGLHLCLGDLRNEAVVHPKTLDKLVAFSNRLVDAWPATQRLLYVHYPFAEGAVAPRLDADYYRPLREIRLPAGTRFIAGCIHEQLSLNDNRRVLAAIEQARGQTVDIAASCGLGRRTPEQAERVLDLTRTLAMLA